MLVNLVQYSGTAEVFNNQNFDFKKEGNIRLYKTDKNFLNNISFSMNSFILSTFFKILIKLPVAISSSVSRTFMFNSITFIPTLAVFYHF